MREISNGGPVMRALVTGAAGFVGSTLIEELTTLGFEVVGLVRPGTDPELLENLHGLRYTRMDGDPFDRDAIRRALDGVDYVFHSAGVLVSKGYDGYIRHNVDATRVLADAVAQDRPALQRFVFVSSQAAGGPPAGSEPKDELSEDRPVSAYGETKLMAERILLNYRERFPISIVRPPLVYGPKDRLIFSLVKLIERNFMPVFRPAGLKGDKRFNVVHVRDLCRGLLQAALADSQKVKSGEVFYLGSDEVVTYLKLANTIADQLNRHPLRFSIPQIALRTAAVGAAALGLFSDRVSILNPDRLNDFFPDNWTCSCRKAKEFLGFVPEYDIVAGMADTIEWYKRQGWL